MRRRNPHKTITIIRQPRQARIPRQERGQQRKQPTGLDDGLVGGCGAVAVDVADAEEEEGDVDGDEDAAEDEGGFEGAEDEEEGEDEPALARVNGFIWMGWEEGHGEGGRVP